MEENKETKMEVAKQTSAEETPTAEPTKTFIINGKELTIRLSELNEALAHIIVLTNILGQPYWEECKKVFTITGNLGRRIDKLFE